MLLHPEHIWIVRARNVQGQSRFKRWRRARVSPFVDFRVAVRKGKAARAAMVAGRIIHNVHACRIGIPVLHNIDLMLAQDRIHGDLSAYNILYWEGNIALIDFPQVVLLRSNPAAWAIFQRDIARICQYFISQGIERNARNLAADLWTSYGHKIRTDVHPRDLDADKAEDRFLWEKQKGSH